MALRLGSGQASPAAAELKKLLLTMIVSVVVLDGAAMGFYYALHVGGRAPRTQAIFGGVWTALTLVIVLTYLSRIKKARVRARRLNRG